MTERSSADNETLGPVSTTVGDVTGVMEFEGDGGNGRIGVRKTMPSESDVVVLQTTNANGRYHTIEEITVVERFFSRELSWKAIDDDTDTHSVTATLHTDGGCEPNPGPAGIGYVMYGQTTNVTGNASIGEATNNEAEYHALIHGIKAAKQNYVDVLSIRVDSRLVVKQVTGEYSVNAANLQPLHEEVLSLLDSFADYDIEHVPREQNSTADSLATEAIPN
jgi:ribonuclease HI